MLAVNLSCSKSLRYNIDGSFVPLRRCCVSLIWDLLRRSDPLENPRMEEVLLYDLTAERRRSSRTSLYVPLFVYGYSSAEEPFYQETNSLEVNANGGLLHLRGDANVRRGQKLLVMNRLTKEEQECYVVTLAKRPKHEDLRVGVAFAKAAPGFWESKE